MLDSLVHEMDIVVLQGSVRPGNYTAKAARLLEVEAQKHKGIQLERINPSTLPLPLPGEEETEDVEQLKQKVKSADGIIMATPEYHGSFSSVTKLLIDNLGFPSVLEDKPVKLLGVAAGRLGAVKALEHLQSVIQHVGGNVVPSYISIARVRDKFDENGQCLDEQTEKQIRGLIPDLSEYIKSQVEYLYGPFDLQAS